MVREQRVAVITGGATGIGLAIAKRFAQADCAVFAISAPWEDLSELAWLPKDNVLLADFREQASVLTTFNTLAARTQRVDVLVNNAGVYERRKFSELSLETWSTTLQVNLTAPFLCSQALIPFLDPRRNSYIINVASDAYRLGPARGVHYAASKGGLVAMTRALACAMVEYGTRVIAVAPGIVRTRQSAVGGEAKYAEAAKVIPLGRVAQPDDIAASVVALTSGAFDYLTGQTIQLTGGRFTC